MPVNQHLHGSLLCCMLCCSYSMLCCSWCILCSMTVMSDVRHDCAATEHAAAAPLWSCCNRACNSCAVSDLRHDRCDGARMHVHQCRVLRARMRQQLLHALLQLLTRASKQRARMRRSSWYVNRARACGAAAVGDAASPQRQQQHGNRACNNCNY